MEAIENVNNEVVEVAEDYEEESSGNGLKIAGMVALVAGAGYGLYRAGKWAWGKIKAKKEAKNAESPDNVIDFKSEDDGQKE